MRRYPTILAAAVSFLLVTAARADDLLNIGDPAPKLDVSGWVKGEKVEQFEPGKTYVVEFWATWCGPCRVSIPHLTELAHKHKDKVRFIGVDAFERDVSKVRPFVEEMGARMDYSVALDAVPDKGDPLDGAMARNWMVAAEEDGIPTAFVVHDGKIAWIGHPMRMDEPLEQILAGRWDPQPLMKSRLAAKTRQHRISTADKKVGTPYKAGDYRATLSAIEELASADPELARKGFAGIKLNCLVKLGAIEEALKLGTELLEANRDRAPDLSRAFADVLEMNPGPEPDPRLSKLALQAARRANELTRGKNFQVLDHLAVALYRAGDIAKAVATEEKAIEVYQATILEKDKSRQGNKSLLKRLESNLETFLKAAAAKGIEIEKS